MKFLAWLFVICGVVASASLVVLLFEGFGAVTIIEASLWAVASFALAYGVFRKRRFALPLGLLVIAMNLVARLREVTPVVLQESPSVRFWILALIWLLFTAVSVGLGLLWYRHRRYFQN